MSDDKAAEAKLKILQYLNDDDGDDTVSKKVVTVTLESSKARCFQTCLEEKLRSKIMKRNGTLNVVQQSKHPLILKVSVEGEQAATDEMTRAVHQIWQERVDFSMVSTTATDSWLIMKGLNGQLGKDFVSKFEKKHNCFLEACKDDGLSFPRARVSVEDVMDSFDDAPAEASTSAEGYTYDSDSVSETDPTSDVFKNVDKGRNMSGLFPSYQRGMSEEEAVKLAMKMSMKRTVTEARQLPSSGASHLEYGHHTGQAQHRQHANRDRSSGSQGHSRHFFNRKRPARGDTNRRDNKRRKTLGSGQKRKSHSSRDPDSRPVPNFELKVVAENRDMCIQARNAFVKKLKEKFLHEEKIDKIQKISPKAKQEIANIILSNDIKSIPGKGDYTLRGQKGNVLKASANVMKVLLAEKNILEVKRKRKANTKRETKEFVEVMVHDEPEVPAYWKNHKPGETLKSALISAKRFRTKKRFETIELKKDSQSFASIVKMVNATFDPTLVGKGQDAIGLNAFAYKKLFILKVERIENLHLYEQFTRRRQKLFLQLFRSGAVRFPKLKDIPKCSGGVATSRLVRPVMAQDIHPEINEYFLFHGTKESNIRIICNDGLDPRLGSGNAMFGPGIYGAESATKADQYADEKNNRSAGKDHPKKMLLIRMALGNSFLCTEPNPHKYRRPPCTQCYKDDCRNTNHAGGRYGHFFDSVVGDNKKLFREFVVYDDSLCYPEYLITYERR